jgi:cyclohexanecarboxylate-CoA ligase
MRLVMPKEDYVAQGYWRNENLYRYLERAAAHCPEKVAVVDQFGRYTYREIDELVRKLAGAFKAGGIGEGDVVSFQLPNWSEAVIVHQALAMIGAVSNPIISIYRHKEVRYILEQSGTKILFVPHTFRDFDYLEMVRSLADEITTLEMVVVVDKYHEELELRPGEELYSAFLDSGVTNDEVFPVGERDPALLLYTSGTTAEPKGVLHTHNTLAYENRTMIELYSLGTDDVVFMPSPVTHITGLLYGLELPFMVQGKVIFQDVWEPEEAIRHLTQEGGTWIVSATPFLRGIFQKTKELGEKRLRLKAFACGGADVPPELVKEATQVLGCYVTRVYGSTEYPTLTACGYQDPIEKAAHTDGRLLEGSSVKILGNDGEEVLGGEIGELAVKGPEMFLGYLQPEHNQGAFLEDGYFLTGDMAIIDQDGYLEIKGREKDIIIRGGENISVKEVEDLLYRHPKISEVAIVGMPDSELGEKACAYLVPEEGEKPTLDEIGQFLTEEGIAKQKLPERLEVVDQMPMTASGKIQKFLLKEEIERKLEA